MQEIFLSVIIPTCNRNDLLKTCLDSLHNALRKVPDVTYEVIVSDDSANNSAKKFSEQYPWVRCIAGPRNGPAANRNFGAKNATGKWLIFLDDDCVPDSEIISNYVIAQKKFYPANVFEGCIKVDRPQRSFNEESPINETGGYLWSCNFMILKNTFHLINGFEEGFPYPAMEDVEFHYRLKIRKEEIVFLPDCFVIHPWRTQKKMFSTTIKRFKSLLFFLKLHPENKKDLNTFYYLRVVANQIKTLFLDCIKFRFRGIGGKFCFIFLHFCFAVYFFFQK